ncbi:zf-TFIIB domain-containing protein [bacterium]|nr:zf-TFIIB domain-containing protein [candidate division CSSED10-310 bacterium]
MECPVCRESMIVIEYDDIELDYCVGCMGVWFDAGEIELMLGKSGIPFPSEALRFRVADTDARELRRPCPLCGKTMQKVCPEHGRVILDRCPAGEGIWFDAGEIREVIKESAGAAGDIVLGALRRYLGEALAEK